MSADVSYQSIDAVSAPPGREAPESQFGSARINLRFVLDFGRRRLWVIAFSFVICCGAGLTYFLAVPAPYTGTAILKIDPRKFQLFQPATNLGDQIIAAGEPEIESHLEALKSENLVLKIIAQFHLEDDPEFGLAPAIPIISSLIESPHPESETWRIRNALRIFARHYTVERDGIYLIAINFTSANPQRSAEIANAVAETYISEQLDGQYEVTREGSKWLEGRIKELRDQVSDSRKAVIDYKVNHEMVDAGNGRLIVDQALTDLNNQLTVARAKTSGMRARLDRINAALNDPAEAGLIDATASEELSNPLIMKLRTQYLDFAAREADWSEKYGYNHMQVVNLRDNMRGIRNSILDELKRLREAYAGDYEVARDAERLIAAQLQRAIAESQTSNKAQVTLNNLETSAETFKTMYDNFVKKYAEATEQQSFPYTEAKLITKATPPIARTYKKSLMAVAMMPFMGLVLGIGLGALGEFLDGGFRTSNQIEAMLGVACIALVPLQRKPSKRVANQSPPNGTPNPISSKLSVSSRVVEQPLSGFAEAIRTIKVSAVSNGPAVTKVVAITSAIPDEGKSTVASALAMSIAQVGGRVVLVDCDLRNPSLSRAIKPDANAGILEVLSGKVTLDEALCREIVPNMGFLPVASKVRSADSIELLNSSAMRELFEKMRHCYDYIIVDLPPLAPLADARAAARFVDSYLLVVEWGRTSRALVQHALSRAPGLYEKVVGAVLNKVDMRALKLYDGNRATYYYDKRYRRYGLAD